MVFFKVMFLHSVPFHYVSFLCSDSSVLPQKARWCEFGEKAHLGQVCQISHGNHIKKIITFRWTALQLRNEISRLVWLHARHPAHWVERPFYEEKCPPSARTLGTHTGCRNSSIEVGDWLPEGWIRAGSPVSSSPVTSKGQPEMKTAGPGSTSGSWWAQNPSQRR